MSLLTILRDVSDRVGIPRPSTVISATDQATQQLLGLANEEGRSLRARQGVWQELIREANFTTTSGQAAYHLDDIAADFDFFVNNSQWDRTQRWPLDGPITPQSWQAQQVFTIASPWRQFIVTGSYLRVYPTPSQADTYYFFYSTKAWCLPATWVAGTSYAAGATVSYRNNRYTTSAGGTSGSTAPTHTSGSASDGGVTWDYADQGYEAWVADTDIPIFDAELMKLGIRWRYLSAKKFDYAEEFRTYEEEVEKAMSRSGGKSRIYLGGGDIDNLGVPTVPLTGFGS